MVYCRDHSLSEQLPEIHVRFCDLSRAPVQSPVCRENQIMPFVSCIDARRQERRSTGGITQPNAAILGELVDRYRAAPQAARLDLDCDPEVDTRGWDRMARLE